MTQLWNPTPAAHDGWMWDLTVPGNGDHDFYVVAGSTPVLVHNTNRKVHDPERSAEPGSSHLWKY